MNMSRGSSNRSDWAPSLDVKESRDYTNGSAQAQQSESRFSVLEVWQAIRKNWALATGITLVVILGVAFYTLGQTRIYEATAVVLFDASNPQPLGNQFQPPVDTAGQYWNNKEYYRTQIWIVGSQPIAEAVVQQLNLNKDPTFLDQVPRGTRRPPREVSVETAAQMVIASLAVEQIKDSRLAEVKYRDADPERAQQIVSTLVDAYVQNNLDELMSASAKAADWLRDQLANLGKELENSELSLHQYKKDKNILYLSLDDQTKLLREEMEQLNTALTTVRQQTEQVASRRNQVMKVNNKDPTNLPVTEFLNSSTLQRLRAEYVNASSDLDGLLAAGKGTNHPEVRAASSRRDAVKAALLAEIQNLKGAIDGDLSATNQQEQGLKRLFMDAQKQALDLNLLEIEYNRLARARENNEKLFSFVQERSKESDLAKMLRINNIRVVERPARPKRPVTPNVPMNMLGGIAVGLVLGLGFAVGREQLDRSIKTPDDAERELELPFLGLLPSVDEGSYPAYGGYGGRRQRRPLIEPSPGSEPIELVVHQKPSSGIAEAARAIRTNVMFMSPDRPYRTLLVTSAGPADGKTTVACCLAIAMAQAGRRVVLVDCDMRRPRLHRVFHVERDAGITTAILEPKPPIHQIARETPIPNLSLVTTGPLPPNPAEILHSESFAKLLETLRASFDCVVIDSPPVVPVTDAAVLSASVDATVLVVRAFQTSKDLARRAVRSLRDVGGHIAGTVLNAVDLSKNQYGYRYYYYYKREGYGSEAPAGPPRDDEGNGTRPEAPMS